MATIRSYHRPETLEDALALLARPDVVTAPLGGGTVLPLALEAGTRRITVLTCPGEDGSGRSGFYLRTLPFSP